MVRLWTREYSPFALMADFNGSIKTAQINGSLQQPTSTACLLDHPSVNYNLALPMQTLLST
jgi:hypothetical protein